MTRTIVIFCLASIACGNPSRTEIRETSWTGNLAATGLNWGLFDSSLVIAAGSSSATKLDAIGFTPNDDSTPERTRVIGRVLELLPAGTTFNPRAELIMPLPKGTPANAVIATGTVGGSTWTELPTTLTSTSEYLSAKIDRFDRDGLFAVVKPK